MGFRGIAEGDLLLKCFAQCAQDGDWVHVEPLTRMMLGVRLTTMRISCRPSGPRPRKRTFHSAPWEGAARTEAGVLPACRLHARVRRQTRAGPTGASLAHSEIPPPLGFSSDPIYGHSTNSHNERDEQRPRKIGLRRYQMPLGRRRALSDQAGDALVERTDRAAARGIRVADLDAELVLDCAQQLDCVQPQCDLLVCTPNDLRISCRRSGSRPHNPSFLSALKDLAAQAELRAYSACRLHARVRLQRRRNHDLEALWAGSSRSCEGPPPDRRTHQRHRG
jgi:hypothetical protein